MSSLLFAKIIGSIDRKAEVKVKNGTFGLTNDFGCIGNFPRHSMYCIFQKGGDVPRSYIRKSFHIADLQFHAAQVHDAYVDVINGCQMVRNRPAKVNPRSYARWHKVPNEDDEDGTVAAGKRSVTLANLRLCNHYTRLPKT